LLFIQKVIYIQAKGLSKTEFISIYLTPLSKKVGFVRHLIRLKGRDIWLVGGSDIISIFLNASLVDEIILSIHPIVLTEVIPLFKNIQRQLNLKLLKSNSYESGLVQSHYEVEKRD
jgi:dihydrofolate reductase